MTQIERSKRNFARKWSSYCLHDDYLKPYVQPKYDIGYVVKNCDINGLRGVEPWSDGMFIDNESLVEHYIKEEQPNTKFDLKKAEERAHILIGLATAVENIDAIIKIIKKVFMILIEINNAPELIQEKAGKLVEELTPDKLDLTIVESQVIKKMLIQLSKEGFSSNFFSHIKIFLAASDIGFVLLFSVIFSF